MRVTLTFACPDCGTKCTVAAGDPHPQCSHCLRLLDDIIEETETIDQDLARVGVGQLPSAPLEDLDHAGDDGPAVSRRERDSRKRG